MFGCGHKWYVRLNLQDVELVWTLGAMLAKSAELSRSSSNSSLFTLRFVGVVLVLVCTRILKQPSYGKYNICLYARGMPGMEGNPLTAA